MLSYKLYKVLKDIVQNTFPEKEYPNNIFSKYFLEIKSEENKKAHGYYYPSLKKIEIFNLSRPTGHIVITTIHEVSHHIDYCIRKNSDHHKKFYEIMHLLLIKALGMGIITREDILTAIDSADIERLNRYFGKIEAWKIECLNYKQELATIKIKNSFSIKDILKSKGYRYSSTEQSWEKEINKSEVEEEKEFLFKIISKSNVLIIEGGKIDINAIYYIIAKDKECKNEDYLLKNGYYKNGYNMENNCWNKKIKANDLKVEKRKIEILPGIKFTVKGIDKN